LIPTPPDPFDEWLALPVDARCEDPRFEVLQARPEDFERIYDCVDEAFGRPRPRELFDWMYRRNPYGRARIWYVEEKASGRILKTGASFTWPIWRGDVALRGVLAGDAATVPDWQRKGLSEIRRKVVRSHPWHGTIVAIAEPNEGSRIVTTKAGEASSILGPLRGGVAVLRAGPLLAKTPLPAGVAGPIGALVSPLFSTWQRLGARVRGDLRFEPIDRFHADFDELTLRTMRFPLYWCPHNAEFLNWRYLDHPIESYAAFALVEAEQPVGYAVIRIAGHEATLSEFAVSADRAEALLARSLSTAREAGCASVNFFAPPSWRHWPLFRKAGFLPYTTDHHFHATDQQDKATSASPDAWQVTPGDRDYH
jgi:GNAT superfamily N-acetyltransferase